MSGMLNVHRKPGEKVLMLKDLKVTKSEDSNGFTTLNVVSKVKQSEGKEKSNKNRNKKKKRKKKEDKNLITIQKGI